MAKKKFTGTTKREALAFILEADPNRIGYPEPYTTVHSLLGNEGLGSLGYFGDTNQCCIQISIRRDTDMAALKADIEFVLPLIKPLTGECAGKTLGIFEYTLSEHRTWDIAQHEDSRWYLGGFRHGHRLEDASFDSLDEALAHIQKYLPRDDPSEAEAPNA